MPRSDRDSALVPAGTWRPAVAASGRAPALLVVVSSVTGADAAVRSGADLVDLGTAAPQEIMAVRARHPGVGLCAVGAPADVVADVAAARATGVMAICTGIVAARASGLPAARLLVDVPLALVPQACQEGWAAVVDADQAAAQAQGSADPADDGGTSSGAPDDVDSGVLAIAAIASWLGAAAVRTRHPGPVRRALDMTASIRGIRPPARAVRGLA